MQITILTLFPEIFSQYFQSSIMKRAIEKKHVSIHTVNIRNFATDTHKSVDDKPYGGGGGMILRVDIVHKALEWVKTKTPRTPYTTILLDPSGTTYNQTIAQSLSKNKKNIILICGHYEGIDYRIRSFIDQELSIGDYILTGGEIPAMILVDSIVRLIPGVLGYDSATTQETFSLPIYCGESNQDAIGCGIEYPQYTKPRSYKGLSVPDVLLSGNHKEIEKWKKTESKKLTKQKRPDLLSNN